MSGSDVLLDAEAERTAFLNALRRCKRIAPLGDALGGGVAVPGRYGVAFENGMAAEVLANNHQSAVFAARSACGLVGVVVDVVRLERWERI
ncbi:MAG: hypothetical protein ACXVZR_11910 [Terriglobales bacterium]